MKRKTSSFLRTALAMLLCLLMLAGVLPAQAYFVTDGEGNVVPTAPGDLILTNSEGETVETSESWESAFPYGAFAFENASLTVSEGEEAVLKVYRLGGTTGRATAVITYQPVVIVGEDGEAVFQYGISADDIVLSVEEPQPIALYQPVGRPPEPARGDAAVTVTPDEAGYVIALSAEADSYEWQICADGVWDDVVGGTAASLPADAEFIDGGEYDYRCVYTIGGERFCTDSYLGEVYEPAPEEVLEEIPEDIELNAAPVYTPVDLSAGETAYDGVIFELIFAEGEWVKEIHFDALTDGVSETEEAAAVTIRGCVGGEVYAGLDICSLRVADVDAPDPSTVGFTAEAVSADKADGTVELLVRREGGNTRPVSVTYSTEDGTAAAGRDYVAASGTLMFYGDVDELPVTVELIDDGIASEDAVTFSVTLGELKGDENCSIGQETVTVSLTNSAEGTEPNNATLTYDAEAVDLTGSFAENPTAASSGEDTVTAEQVEVPDPEPAYAALESAEPEMTTQVYTGGDKKNTAALRSITFTALQNGWGDKVDAAGSKTYWSAKQQKYDNDGDKSGDETDADMYSSGDTVTGLAIPYSTSSTEQKLSSGVAIASKLEQYATLTESGWLAMGGSGSVAGQMYSGWSAAIKTYMGHNSSYWSGAHRYYSYTMPRLRVGSTVRPISIIKFPNEASIDDVLDKNWAIKATDNSDHKESNCSNPFEGSYSGTFGMTDKPNIMLTMYFQNHAYHESTQLNQRSMVWLKNLTLTRRTFKNAFLFEIATPNDTNTAPNGAAVLTDYSQFVPSVAITEGNINGSGQLFVGSTLQVEKGSAPVGYDLTGIVVYQSTDNGATWHNFNKFTISGSSGTYTITTVGTSDNPLYSGDLNAQYKIRAIYQRSTNITVHFEPSVPRKADNSLDTAKADLVLSGYGDKSDHGFTTGSANTNLSYQYSTRSGEDFGQTLSTVEKAKPTTLNGSADNTWSFSAYNIQCVNFNLDADDMLLVNGRAYAGNETIWLTEADFAGGMHIYYYHQDYQSAISAMKTSIAWMGVFWDGNGDEVISGTFNDNDTFTVAAPDVFVGYLDAGEYSETEFAPVQNANGKWCQYFIKVCYSMQPRSLTVPSGESADGKAQVLPAFITALNKGTEAYSAATPEQKAYKYIVSGRAGSTTADYTSDNHPMYGADATKKTCVDIPLGGDNSPAVLDTAAQAFTWSPDYRGNLLYPYAKPAPIKIEDSIAGETDIAVYTVTSAEGATPTYSYTSGERDKLNGYLGSFAGTTTFALVSQIQEHTTAQILADPSFGVKPDSVTLGGVRTLPDAEYLKTKGGTDNSGEGGVDMSNSGNEMEEMNLDIGTDLGSMEIGLSDYVTIVLDGNSVGFAIGLPLGEIGKEGNSAAEKKNFKDKNSDNWNSFKDFFDKGSDVWKDYKNAKSESAKPKNQQDKSKFSVAGLSVSFSVGLAFMFQYNPLDNGYYFEGMTFSAAAELEFRAQHRLTVCPIVFVYVQVEAGVEITTGLGVIRDSKDDTPLIDAKTAANKDKAETLQYVALPSDFGAVINSTEYGKLEADEKKAYTAVSGVSGYYWNSGLYESYGEARSVYLETAPWFLSLDQYAQLDDAEKASYKLDNLTVRYYNIKYADYAAAQTAFLKETQYAFETQYKAFNIRFNGRIYVDVYEKDASGAYVQADSDDYFTGFLRSDGISTTQVVLKKQDGMELNQKVRVVIRALDYDENLVGDETVIDYLAPIKSIRDDVYWKGISIAPSLSVEVGAGVGIEMLKLELFFRPSLEFEFTLGKYNPDYDPDDSVSANHDKYLPASLDSFDLGVDLGVRVVAFILEFELDAVHYGLTYDSDKDDWSGEWSFLNGWAGDAVDNGYRGVHIRMPEADPAQRLYALPGEDSMSTQAIDMGMPFELSGYGASTKAGKLGEALPNNLSYRLISVGSRDFIVYTISRTGVESEDVPMLVLSELMSKDGVYGLVNPLDNTSLTPYIVLDNDGTGDLDFTVWADGTTVHAAWVSYVSVTPPASAVPTPPTGAGASYVYGGVTMDGDNYDDVALKPTAPTAVAQPAESDYYTTTQPDPADGWTSVTDDTTNTTTWYKDEYADLAAAQAAYTAADGAYQTYVTEKSNYEDTLARYTAWHDYFAALSSAGAAAQVRLKNAAQNTQIKTASWDTTSTAAGFGAAEVVYGAENDAVNYLFAPAATDSGVLFFGKTDVLDDGTQLAAYDQYLTDAGISATVRDYRYQMRKSTLDVMGTVSGLNMAYKDGSGAWKVVPVSLNNESGTNPKTVDNIEFVKIGSAYYLAYTTSQELFEKDAAGKYTECFTEKRLYFRAVTINDTTGAPEFGSPYLIRIVRDYDSDSTKDGLYNTAGTKTAAYESPYFANLQFLRGKIDADMLTGGQSMTTQAVAEHTFLLFEMNGTTYIVLDNSFADPASGTMYPFFTGQTVTNADNTTATMTASGKMNVTIGTDSGENIYAVYTASVNNTTNNGLYLSLYDADRNVWGEGKLLAMNNLSVYEKAAAESWTDAVTRAAFLGYTGKSGLLTDADIEHLFDAADVDAIKSVLHAETLGDSSNFVFGAPQAIAGQNEGELLVVAPGTLTTLGVTSSTNGGKTTYSLLPTYKDGVMDTSLGMYAISYGKGTQKLGLGGIRFSRMDFTAGSKLNAEISVTNVGDAAFRGEAQHPLAITLTVGGQKIGEWTHKDLIKSGQTLALDTPNLLTALDADLKQGDAFVLTVAEDSGYFSPAASDSIILYTVDDTPDLGVEELTISNPKLSADGKKTTLDISFNAVNRGAVTSAADTDAKGVYVQLSYAVGTYADTDETLYAPLPIAAGALTVDEEKDLMTTQGVTSDVLASGIRYLGDIRAGKGRLVHGTVTVPMDAFALGKSERLELKVTIYSGDAVTTTDVRAPGVLFSSFGENNTANNSASVQMEALTAFRAAPSVVIPLGSTTLIPLSATSTRGEAPVIAVGESTDEDGGNDDGQNLAILNFKKSEGSDGTVSGVLSITPSAMGTGVINVYDTTTNTFTPISFTVTSSDDGIDIFNDNETFTFHEANNDTYSSSNPSSGWKFNDISTWGSGADEETPLRSNLAIGVSGTYFTFNTVAEAIDLYVDGTVEVSTKNPNGVTSTGTATGGKTPVRIALGENGKNRPYEVTVKVTSARAVFDRLVEQYSNGTVPIPTYDATAPNLYWSRSFPATATIDSDNPVPIPLKVYLLDNNGISSVTVNGVQLDTSDSRVTQLDEDGLLWVYDFGGITANGTYDFTVTDISNNTTTETLVVDWFNQGAPSTDNSIKVPAYTPEFRQDGSALPDAIYTTEGLGVVFTADAGNPKSENNTFSVARLVDDSFVESPSNTTGESIAVGANGIYWAMTSNSDNTWSRTLLYLGKIDQNVPVVTLSYDSTAGALIWTAKKDGAAEITDVTSLES